MITPVIPETSGESRRVRQTVLTTRSALMATVFSASAELPVSRSLLRYPAKLVATFEPTFRDAMGNRLEGVEPTWKNQRSVNFPLFIKVVHEARDLVSPGFPVQSLFVFSSR